MTAHPGYVLETIAWNVPRVLDMERPHSFETTLSANTLQALHIDRIDSPVVYLGSLYAVLLLALVGVVAEARRLLPRRALFAVWAVPILNIAPALVIYGLARYRAPADPFLVMLAAVGIVALLGRVARRSANPG